MLIFSIFCGLLSGEVELENLPLRKDALRNLGLPLQAHKGIVGRIKLQIPVRQFRSAPWCITVEDVYIVIGPINLDEVTFNVFVVVICFRLMSRNGCRDVPFHIRSVLKIHKIV